MKVRSPRVARETAVHGPARNVAGGRQL